MPNLFHLFIVASSSRSTANLGRDCLAQSRRLRLEQVKNLSACSITRIFTCSTPLGHTQRAVADCLFFSKNVQNFPYKPIARHSSWVHDTLHGCTTGDL